MKRLILILVFLYVACIPVVGSHASTLSVTSFGAKCDGKKDDTAAIRAALNAANAGDTVTFPANKTCKITDSISPKGSTTLQGLPGSKIVQAGNHHLLIITANDVSTNNLTLRHNGTSVTSNVVRIEGASGFYLYNTTIERTDAWNVYLLGGCHHGTINGLTILKGRAGNIDDGLDIAECHDVTILRPDIHTNDDAISFKSYDNVGGTHHITVQNGTLRSDGAAAIGFGNEIDTDLYAIDVSDLDIVGHFGIQFRLDNSARAGFLQSINIHDIRQTGDNWASVFVQKYDTLSRTADITIDGLTYTGSVLDCVHIMRAGGFTLSNIDCNSPAQDGRYSVWLESASGNVVAGQSHGTGGGVRLDASPGNTVTMGVY